MIFKSKETKIIESIVVKMKQSRMNGLTIDQIEYSLNKLWDYYYFEIVNTFLDMPKLVDTIELARSRNKVLSEQLWGEESKNKEKVSRYREQHREQQLTHEAEIIRLKDIIQAKQVQIDKLLEGNNNG